RASIVPVSVYKKSTQECWIDNEELKFTFNAKEYALPFSKILLPGPHNQSNIMHAVSAVLPYLKSAESVIATLKTFSGIEHRIEYCGKLKDISCYNDSKATNLDSVQAALKSFPENIHLIMGGRDKKGEFQLIETYADHIKTAYLIGEAADSIQSQIPKIETQICNTMENAIDSALNNFVKGDILLLSPGCASFDQYANFEERGRHFKQLIKAKK
ncbi:MAG: UDP-N-acetylmuramoyl-L-alanine--D-glutamate ligase, partial [Candidatus Marinimicrobia bacterium]|nr:UDP-N-acetylmuramoyl-L-alanine--D-glutamate ligase [Candidatus Neomarinimicrobiota bacterium]